MNEIEVKYKTLKIHLMYHYVEKIKQNKTIDESCIAGIDSGQHGGVGAQQPAGAARGVVGARLARRVGARPRAAAARGARRRARQHALRGHAALGYEQLGAQVCKTVLYNTTFIICYSFSLTRKASFCLHRMCNTIQIRIVFYDYRIFKL